MSRSKMRHYAVMGAVGVVCTGVMVSTFFDQDSKSTANSELAKGVEVLKSGKDLFGALTHLEKAKELHDDVVTKKVNELEYGTSSPAVVELFPRSLDDRENLAKEYTEKEPKQYAKAQALLEQLIQFQCGYYVEKNPAYNVCERNSSKPPLSRQLAEALIEQGKNDEALVQLERTIALFPDDFHADRKAYDRVKENGKGQKARIINIASKIPDWDARSLGELLNQTCDASYDKNTTEAPSDVRRLNDFLKLNPNSTPVRLTRAKVFVNGERSKQAIDDASQVLEAFPGLAEALTIRAIAYSQERKFDLALADLDAALKQIPNSVAILRQKARVYELMGRWDDAVSTYNQVLTVCPWHNETLRDQTVLLSALGRVEDAKKVADGMALYKRLDHLSEHRYPSYLSFNYRSHVTNDTQTHDVQTDYYAGNFDRAQKELDISIKSNGGHDGFSEMNVRLQLAKGNSKEASKLLEKTSFDDQIENELNLEVLQANKDESFAIKLSEAIEQARLLKPGRHGPSNDTGCIREAILCGKFGKPSAAADLIREHMQHASNWVEPVLTLVCDLRRMGKTQLADDLMQLPAKVLAGEQQPVAKAL